MLLFIGVRKLAGCMRCVSDNAQFLDKMSPLSICPPDLSICPPDTEAAALILLRHRSQFLMETVYLCICDIN